MEGKELNMDGQDGQDLKKEGGQVRKAHELRIRNEELGMKRQGEWG